MSVAKNHAFYNFIFCFLRNQTNSIGCLKFKINLLTQRLTDFKTKHYKTNAAKNAESKIFIVTNNLINYYIFF